MKIEIFSEAIRPPASIFGVVVALDKGFQEILNFMTLTLTQGCGDLEKGQKSEKWDFLGGRMASCFNIWHDSSL